MCFYVVLIQFLVKIADQYLSFISPSASLFSLLPPLPNPSASALNTTTVSAAPVSTDSYRILNSPTSSDQDIEDETERIANGLFSAVVTMGA